MPRRPSSKGPKTEKLSITLPADMVAQIRAKVEDGVYLSNSEVIRNAVLNGWAAEQRAIDVGIRRGLADADAGRLYTIDDTRARLHARFKEKYGEHKD